MARSFQIWSVLLSDVHIPWRTVNGPVRGNTYGYVLFFMERSSTKQILPRQYKVWWGGAVLNGECCRAGRVWRSCIAVVRILHSLVGFVRSSLRTVYAEQTEICNHPIPSLPRCDAIFEGIDRLLVTWIALTTWSWTMVVHQGLKRVEPEHALPVLQ